MLVGSCITWLLVSRFLREWVNWARFPPLFHLPKEAAGLPSETKIEPDPRLYILYLFSYFPLYFFTRLGSLCYIRVVLHLLS